MARSLEERIEPDDSNTLRLFTNERRFAELAERQGQEPKLKEDAANTSRSALHKILKFLGLKRN